MLTRRRVLGAAIESTSGTIETLDETNCEFNVMDLVYQANIDHDKRPSPGSFGHHAATMGMRAATITFKTLLTGDGAGGVPGWASTFLPACGWVNDSGTFSPKTESPGSNVKTLTMAVYEDDGQVKKIRGAAGAWKIAAVDGKVIVVEWTFSGAYQTVVAGSLPSGIDYPEELGMRFAAPETFTLGGSALACLETLEIDSGNTVHLRPCPNNADGSGIATGIVTDRLPMLRMNPEARAVGTEDVFGKWTGGTEEALSLVLDDGTDQITIAAPKAQRINVQEGDRSGQQIEDIEFQCNKSADAGDDELTIAFAAGGS